MTEQTFESVWDAISDTPEEAKEMKQRSDLMISLKNHIERNNLDLAQSAAQLKVSKRQIAYLIQGNITLLDLDTLMKMADAASLPLLSAVANCAK